MLTSMLTIPPHKLSASDRCESVSTSAAQPQCEAILHQWIFFLLWITLRDNL